MTDFPQELTVPSRLGASITSEDGDYVLHLVPSPQTCVHGAVRTSAVALLVDVVAAIQVDRDPDSWLFTTDLSMRMWVEKAPERVNAYSRILREGRRSATCHVRLTDDEDQPFGSASVGFARVPRRPDDPPKPEVDPFEANEKWGDLGLIDKPVRDAVGIESIDPATGRIMFPLGPEVKNPSGAMHGAMVALAVEATAEDLAAHHLEGPHLVTDIDMRFLGQGRVGPVMGRSWFVGPPHEGAIEVELVDLGQDAKLVAVGYTRVRPVPAEVLSSEIA